MTVHPIFETILSSHSAPLFYRRTDDLPRAEIEVDAPLMIGSLCVADICGKVWVYRQDGRIYIDDIEVSGWKAGAEASAGIGLDTGGRFRELTFAQQDEHVVARAFHRLVDDPDFIERAELALEEASQP